MGIMSEFSKQEILLIRELLIKERRKIERMQFELREAKRKEIDFILRKLVTM